MLPLGLKELETWVVAKKDSKIPMNAKTGLPASVSNSNTWSNFKTAKKAVLEGSFVNLGFVFNNCGLVGIDIDGAIDENGCLSRQAMQIIDKFKSYTEISRSGRGIHIIVAGDIPFKGKNNGNHIEIYKDGRYFVLTGKVLKYKEITANQEALDWVISKHFYSRNIPKMNMDFKKSIPQIEAKVTIDFDVIGKKIKFKWLYKRIHEGSRNIVLASIVGTLKNSGYSKNQAYKMIRKINKIVCLTSLEESEIKTIVRSIYRYGNRD